MRYREIITELFDTNVKWNISKQDKRNMIFVSTIDGKDVEIEYHSIDDNFSKVSVSFTVDGEWDVTGTGSAMRIFGAVINNMKQFISKVNPNFVAFTAIKVGNTAANDDEYTTRSNLYKRMIIRFADNSGYSYDFQDQGHFDRFVLIKKDKDNEQS
jgi:hypothetical protein